MVPFWQRACRLLIIFVICVLAGAEVDIFVPSFPELQRYFDLSPAQVQLTVSVNFVAYCICSLFAGSLGDRFNRRTVVLLSLVVFALGSLCCVLANQFTLLVLGRALQGIGMAGPAVLGMLFVLDDCSKAQRPKVMGIFNGLITLSMAFAPIVGSQVNLAYGWRANFWLLFILSLVSLLGGFLSLPSKESNPGVQLSLKAYRPLLASRELTLSILGLSLLSVAYWAFIALSPLLYMDYLGVPLSQFGYYQGAICGVFGLMSVSSGFIIRRFGEGVSLRWALRGCVISGLVLLALSFGFSDHPTWITLAMLLFAVVAVFPFNIVYPYSLHVLPHTSGRATALFNAMRLFLTALSVQALGYLFTGRFLHMGILMGCSVLLGVYCLLKTRLLRDGESTLLEENTLLQGE